MILDKDSSVNYKWGDVCECFVLLENEGLSVKQEIIPQGAREKLHFHKLSQQFFFVLKGQAIFHYSGKEYILIEGQGLHVSPGQKHFVVNEAKTDLELLVISQPSTNNDRYEEQ